FTGGDILQLGLTKKADPKHQGWFLLTETLAGEECGKSCGPDVLNRAPTWDDVSNVDVVDGRWKVTPNAGSAKGSVLVTGTLSVVLDDENDRTGSSYDYKYYSNGQLVLSGGSGEEAIKGSLALYADAHRWTKANATPLDNQTVVGNFAYAPGRMDLNMDE